MHPGEHQRTQQSDEPDDHEQEESHRLLDHDQNKKKQEQQRQDRLDPDAADADALQQPQASINNQEGNNNDDNQSLRASEYARIAMQRQQQFNVNRRTNNRDGIREGFRQRDQYHDQARAGNADNTAPPGAEAAIAPPPPPAGIRADNQQNNRTNLLDISGGSLGLNMSFGNMWTSLNEAEEQRITDEFFFDMLMMIICVTVIYCCIQADPKGCGIPVREWLMVFSIIYFSRSVFQLGKIAVVRYMNELRLYYDILAFCIANGALIYWMYRGYDIFYSDANDCDNYDSTAFFNSIMFMVLFVGYLIGFVYLMVLLTLPCLYFMIREQAETNRLQSGGVGRSQVPMILASLSRTQYDPQLFQHEKNCIVCLVDYEETDIVTQLRCHEHHYFHTKCIEDWVKQGNNRCPLCRAPILDYSRQNEEENESLVSSQDRNRNNNQRRQGNGAANGNRPRQ